MRLWQLYDTTLTSLPGTKRQRMSHKNTRKHLKYVTDHHFLKKKSDEEFHDCSSIGLSRQRGRGRGDGVGFGADSAARAVCSGMLTEIAIFES